MTGRSVAGESVSLVVPVRDETATLPSFLASLSAQELLPAEIVLVDAGSVDGTPALLQRFADVDASACVVRIAPAFPGSARNAGIRASHSDWIAMTDAGTLARPGWLRALMQRVVEDDAVDAVFGSYEPVVQSFLQKAVALCFVPEGEVVQGARVRGPSTASLLIRKRVWEELGGFPEHLRACEDLLFFKALAAGRYRTVWAPDAVVDWRVPSTPAQAFRRFRLYSQHTLRAGLGRSWHLGVAPMYIGAATAVLLAVLFGWMWLVLPFAGLAIRAARSIRLRRHVIADAPIGPRLFLAVCGLIVLIDAAMFAGAIDYVVRRPAAAADACEAA